MITLTFPKLDKALMNNKSLKDEPLESPLRGIIVLNQKAIAFNHGFIIVIDLYDYFVIEKEISDSEQIQTLEGILMYMNGKVFSSDYWSELTKGANMEMRRGSLYVDNPRFSKDLHYKEVDVNIIEPLVKLTIARKLEPNIVDSIAFNFGYLNTIYSVLPTEFKNDDVIFEFNRKDSFVKFTFKKRKHIYGFLVPSYDSVSESFKFENLNNFVDDYQEHLEELKIKNTPPLPPPPTPVKNSEAESVVIKMVLPPPPSKR